MNDATVAQRARASAAAEPLQKSFARHGMLRRGQILMPSSPAGRTLAVSAGIDTLGTGMFLASFILYFVGVVNIPAAKVTLAITVAGAVALLAPVPLGRLADRLGAGPSYVALLVLRGFGYSCYPFISDFRVFVLLTVLLTAADRASTPIQQTVWMAALGKEGRNRGTASIRAIRSIGLTVGFLIAAGACATAEPAVFRALFVANGLSYFVAAAITRRAVSQTCAVEARAVLPPRPTAAARVTSPFRDRWFMAFVLGNGVLWLHDTMNLVLLPIWVIKHTPMLVPWIPALLGVNTVLSVPLQLYVARFVSGAPEANRLLGLAASLLAASCGFFAISQMASASIAVLAILVAVVLLAVVENVHTIATFELCAELAPKAAATRYLGAFSLACAGQKVIGPTLLVVVLMPAGLIGWAVLVGTFGTAALVSRTAARRCLVERQGRPVRPSSDSRCRDGALDPMPSAA